MCLTSISNAPKKLKTYKEKRGWKIFELEISDNVKTTIIDYPLLKPPYDLTKLMFPFYRLNKTYNVPTNRWLYAGDKSTSIKATKGKKHYKPYFHIYLRPLKNILESEGRKLVEVKWRKATATGWQDGKPTVIAKEMFVPKVR